MTNISRSRTRTTTGSVVAGLLALALLAPPGAMAAPPPSPSGVPGDATPVSATVPGAFSSAGAETAVAAGDDGKERPVKARTRSAGFERERGDERDRDRSSQSLDGAGAEDEEPAATGTETDGLPEDGGLPEDDVDAEADGQQGPEEQPATGTEDEAVIEDEATTEDEPVIEDEADADESEAPVELFAAEPLVATSPVTGYGVVGVTWTGDVAEEAVVIEFRTSDDTHAEKDSDELWTAWEQVDAEASPEGVVDGTDPLVVGEVAQVQARVTGPAADSLSDLTLTVIDPGVSAADDSIPVPPEAMSPAGSAVAANVPARPTINSRAAWGADESIMTWTPRQGSIRGAAIHHTAGSNGYTSAQVPAILRGIYSYHAQTRGWGDIGYNFLVDSFGRVWEGRSGGVTRQTIGGHAVNYNTNSTGISVLGNYETATVSNAAVTSVTQLVAWKLALHGVPASGTTSIHTSSNLPRVFGHRDVAATACPGRTLYQRLGEIRQRAAALQSSASNANSSTRPLSSLSDGTFVINPAGNVFLIEKGRRHIASCTMVGHYGSRCADAVPISQQDFNTLKPGGRLYRIYQTYDDRRYWISNGTRRQIFDNQSLRNAGLSANTVRGNASGLSGLRYGKPIVRPGIIVVNRKTGQQRLVTVGLQHSVLGSALRSRTPLSSMPRGQLDNPSIAQMNSKPRTTGVIRNPNGNTFVLTTQGVLRIDRNGPLPRSATPQRWAKAMLNRVGRLGHPDVAVVRQRNQSQLYVIRDGVLRPVTAARARQLNGGSAPRVHVILKITKDQFRVGSPL